MTSISGFLQVTRPETLEFLECFCDEELNLRAVENSDNNSLKPIMSEIPALWPDLLGILNVEDLNYLSAESIIIEKLIKMRKDVYVKSPD